MANTNSSGVKPENNYLQHFNKALENFQQVCQEYSGTPLCQKGKRYRKATK